MIRSMGPALRDESQLGCGWESKLWQLSVLNQSQKTRQIQLVTDNGLVPFPSQLGRYWRCINAAYSVMHMQMSLFKARHPVSATALGPFQLHMIENHQQRRQISKACCFDCDWVFFFAKFNWKIHGLYILYIYGLYIYKISSDFKIFTLLFLSPFPQQLCFLLQKDTDHYSLQ